MVILGNTFAQDDTQVSDPETAVEAEESAEAVSDTTTDDTGSGLSVPSNATDSPGAGVPPSSDESGTGLTPPKDLTDTSSQTGGTGLDPAAAEQQAWEDFFPPPDPDFDWIQLNSGEWLKGELKTIYDYKLEFDSDELGLLTLDLEDVKQIRTARVEAVRVARPGEDASPTTLYGLLTIDEDKVTIGEGDNARTVERDEIISVAQGAEREWDLWSGSLSFGANIRSGNTDVTDTNIQARVLRRRAVSRFVGEYLGNFSSTQGVETSNNHRLTSYFDSFKTQQLYWRVVFMEYVRDKFRNIEHQVTLNSGVGYDIIRSGKIDWEATASAGGLYKRFVSVQPGSPIDNLSPAIGLGTRYDQEVTAWLDFLVDYRLQIVDEENGKLIHHMLTKFTTEFVADLDIELSLIWDRVENPQPAADGSVPSKDDFQTIIGIGYSF